MEENTFDQKKTYHIWFRGYSIKLFIEGLEKYQSYLRPYLKPGNEKLEVEINRNDLVIEWLQENLGENEEDWNMVTLHVPGDLLLKMKSLLPYILEDLKQEREKLISSGAPDGATEALDLKISRIEELMVTGIMATVPIDDKLMGKLSKNSITTKDIDIEVFDEDIKKALEKLGKNSPEENDRAIDDACTLIEDRIRQRCNLPNSIYGEGLIDRAFRPGDGIIKLSDNKEEQNGYWLMYKGFMKALKNPLSHRRQKDITKTRAKQIILFTDYLIGLLEEEKSG